MIGVFGEKKWYFFLLCQSLDRSSFSPRIGSAVEGDASWSGKEKVSANGVNRIFLRLNYIGLHKQKR